MRNGASLFAKAFGQAGDDTFHLGGEGAEADGGIGNDTFLGESMDGQGIASGGKGSDTIIAGAGGNVWGEGQEGADIFVVARDAQRLTIDHFETNKDKIDLTAFDFASFQALKKLDKSGGGFTVKLDADTTLEIRGFDKGSLHAADFIL